jgi:dipeptidase E
MCWFEHAITASSGVPRPVPGLGFLRGSLCVHYDRDSERRSAYTAAVAGGLEQGFALDDGAGLLFEGGRAVEAVAGARGARVLHVASGPDGVTETSLHPTPVLPRPRNGDPAIAELRALRPVRARWRRPLTVPPT